MNVNSWGFFDQLGSSVAVDDIVRAPCPYCRRGSNCRVQSYFTKSSGGQYWSKRADLFLSCQGCDGHFYCIYNSDYSIKETQFGGRSPHISTYPKRPKRQMATSIGSFIFTDDPLEETIFHLFEEIYTAITEGSYRLAAMGLRAVIESVMISKIGDTGTLTGNLNKLLEDGHIARNQAKILEDIIEIGNATIHRQFAPSESEVNIATDIVESIVSAVLIFPQRATGIAGRVPPRPSRQIENSSLDDAPSE